MDCELLLIDTISKPVKPHVNGFRPLLYDSAFDESFGYLVVGCRRRKWLRQTGSCSIQALRLKVVFLPYVVRKRARPANFPYSGKKGGNKKSWRRSKRQYNRKPSGQNNSSSNQSSERSRASGGGGGVWGPVHDAGWNLPAADAIANRSRHCSANISFWG